MYEVDPPECPDCGARMRILALIDDPGVVERTPSHLDVSEPPRKAVMRKGPEPAWPQGENLPLTCDPVPDIVGSAIRGWRWACS